MKDSPWQVRARQCGLTQKSIAELAQRDENSVGRALSGGRSSPRAAGPYIAIILAWEMMNPGQRENWLKAVRMLAEDGE